MIASLRAVKLTMMLLGPPSWFGCIHLIKPRFEVEEDGWQEKTRRGKTLSVVHSFSVSAMQ